MQEDRERNDATESDGQNRAPNEAEEEAAGEFQFGDGYVGGRGYGGTNYDLSHGYRVGSPREFRRAQMQTTSHPRHTRSEHSHGPAATAPRGGYEWGEEAAALRERAPARLGQGPYHERLLKHTRSDDDIQREVVQTLFYDTWVDADAIEVGVHDGVVELSGALPSYEEVRYATDDAWEVEGVRGVRVELEVKE